jgi:C4-type Zn-finger protein
MIDSSHKLFYSQRDAALNIINLAAEDTPRIQGEVEGKISNMKAIINQIEDLTNELVINISSDEESTDEVKNLIDEMENLIDSVKEY